MNFTEKFEIKSLPKGIYIEASILCQSLKNIIGNDLKKLINLSKENEIPIFITDVTFHEWINKRIEEIENIFNELEKKFGNSIGFDPKTFKQNLIKSTEPEAKKNLENSGVSIIKNYEIINLEELIHMAIKKAKPFEKKDKGFRDAVTLFMILEHAKNQKKGEYIFIVNDNYFYEDKKNENIAENIKNILEKYNVEMTFFNKIDLTISEINERINGLIKLINETQNRHLSRFLREKSSQIIEYIKQNVKFKNTDFKPGEINRVRKFSSFNTIHPKININNYSIKIAPLPKEKKEERVQISFLIIANLDILFEIYYSTLTEDELSKIPENFPISLYYSKYPSLEREEEVEMDIKIEGSVYLKKEKNEEGEIEDKYSDLVINNAIVLGEK